MEQLELSIPDMQSAHCQARVTGAIKNIAGLHLQKLEAGKLSVTVESNAIKRELVEAIEKAGYKVDPGGSGDFPG